MIKNMIFLKIYIRNKIVRKLRYNKGYAYGLKQPKCKFYQNIYYITPSITFIIETN